MLPGNIHKFRMDAAKLLYWVDTLKLPYLPYALMADLYSDTDCPFNVDDLPKSFFGISQNIELIKNVFNGGKNKFSNMALFFAARFSDAKSLLEDFQFFKLRSSQDHRRLEILSALILSRKMHLIDIKKRTSRGGLIARVTSGARTLFSRGTMMLQIVSNPELPLTMENLSGFTQFIGETKSLDEFSSWFESDYIKNVRGVTLESLQNLDDEAMISSKREGGINLDADHMDLSISHDGQGVEMNIDPAMIARFRRDGITSLTPRINSITPITSIWTFVGLQAPLK